MTNWIVNTAALKHMIEWAVVCLALIVFAPRVHKGAVALFSKTLKITFKVGGAATLIGGGAFLLTTSYFWGALPCIAGLWIIDREF
jgi:hypothetical protein